MGRIRSITAIFSIVLLSLAATTLGADVALERRSFLDGKLSIEVPREFGPMPTEMLELKYPSSRRPTIVVSNEEGSVNVAINHTQNRIAQSQLGELHDYMERSFRNLHPSADWNRSERIDLNGRQVFVLDLVTPAIDTKIRNIMVGSSLEGRFLIVTFNCTVEEEEAWGAIGERIAASVRISD